MKLEMKKKVSMEDLKYLLEVEQKAWNVPGEHISASEEKIIKRIQGVGDGQSVVLVTIDEKAAGSQFAFRFNWDKNIKNLGSWDNHTHCGWTNKVHVADGDTGFLVGVGVVPEFRGIKLIHGQRWKMKMKISELLIAQTLDNLFFGDQESGKVKQVIANARIPWYHKNPGLTVEEYCHLKRKDGKPYDPVLRFHLRMGAVIIKPIKFAMEDPESNNGGCWVLYQKPFEQYS